MLVCSEICSRSVSSASSISGSRFLAAAMPSLLSAMTSFQPLTRGGDEALHRLLVLGHLRRDDDAVAIDVHAEVDVAHGHDVVELDAARLEIEHRGEIVARDEVDRALHQALLAQLRRQVDVLPLGDAVHLGEGREQPERGVEHRGAELLALEILRPLDAALLQGVDAERREIVGHEDAEDFLARILGVVLDRSSSRRRSRSGRRRWRPAGPRRPSPGRDPS